MPKDHTNKEAYREKYTRFLHDATINMQTILVDDVLAGSIAKFEMEGDAGMYVLAGSTLLKARRGNDRALILPAY